MSELRRRGEKKDDEDEDVQGGDNEEGLIEEQKCPVEIFEKGEEEKVDVVNKEKRELEKEKEKEKKEVEEEEVNDVEVERIQKEIEAFKDLVLKRFDGISKDVTALKRKRRPAEKQPGESIEKLKKTNTVNEKKIKLMIFQHKQEVRYLEEENRRLKSKLNDLLNQNQRNYCFLFITGLALLVVVAAYFLI